MGACCNYCRLFNYSCNRSIVNPVHLFVSLDYLLSRVWYTDGSPFYVDMHCVEDYMLRLIADGHEGHGRGVHVEFKSVDGCGCGAHTGCLE